MGARRPSTRRHCNGLGEAPRNSLLDGDVCSISSVLANSLEQQRRKKLFEPVLQGRFIFTVLKWLNGLKQRL